MTDRRRVPRSGWLALGAVAGALAIGDAGVPMLIAAVLALMLTTGSIATRLGAGKGSRAAGLARAGFLFGAGAFLLIGRATLASVPASVAPGDPTTDPAGRRVAVVESIGSPKVAEQIALLRIQVGTASSAPDQRVEALLPRFPEIGPGDRIAVRGSVRPPGVDDFGAYLRRIGASGSLRSPTLELLGVSDSPQGVLDRLRRGSGDALIRALPEPQAGLAAGILIGLRERVDRELAAAFTTAGVSHIVAISGWNIAIVAALVGALLGGRIGSRPRTALALAAIVGYTFVAGASPSVDRAAVMAVIGLTARAGGRSGPAAAALGWAVLILLLVDPATVTDPGFELSGLATAGLIGWATPLAERLRRIRGRHLPGWLAESLAISLAAQAATLPIILMTFGRLSLVAPIANLAIVPLVPPAMAAGAVALAGGWLGALGLPQPLVSLLGLPAWALLGLLIALVRAAASLPLASILLTPPWNLVTGGIAAAAVTLVISGRSSFSRLGRAVVRVA